MQESHLPKGSEPTKEPPPEAEGTVLKAVLPLSGVSQQPLLDFLAQCHQAEKDGVVQSPLPKSGSSLFALYVEGLEQCKPNGFALLLLETSVLVDEFEDPSFGVLEAEPDPECKLQILEELQGVLTEGWFQFGRSWGIDEAQLKSMQMNVAGCAKVEAESETDQPLKGVNGTLIGGVVEKGGAIRLSRLERQVMEKLSEIEANFVEEVAPISGSSGITAKELMAKLDWSGAAKKATLFKILGKLKRVDVGYILQDDNVGLYNLSMSGREALEQV